MDDVLVHAYFPVCGSDVKKHVLAIGYVLAKLSARKALGLEEIFLEICVCARSIRRGELNYLGPYLRVFGREIILKNFSDLSGQYQQVSILCESADLRQ